MKQTAEGIKSSQAVDELAGKLGVDMPITAAVVASLPENCPSMNWVRCCCPGT